MIIVFTNYLYKMDTNQTMSGLYVAFNFCCTEYRKPCFFPCDLSLSFKPMKFGVIVLACFFPLVQYFSLLVISAIGLVQNHDDVIKWKHFLRNWPFVRGIHRSPVNSPHKGQWRGALMLSLIYVWINDWVNNREAGDLRRYRAHYDVIVMSS